MSLRRLVFALVGFALAAGAPAPALAQKGPGGGNDEIIFRVCNNTNDPARVAVSYEPVGNTQFYNEGWYGVPARSCQDLVRTDNAYIYGYAEVENDGARYWSGDHSLCVQYPGSAQVRGDARRGLGRLHLDARPAGVSELAPFRQTELQAWRFG
jgi:uncharacterized membrane protein